jgi:hypothetical protein
MGRFVDSIITYRILKMLTTPFEDTDAYKLGIIDGRGKELKKLSTLNSADEKDAYTILNRMIFRIKRIIEKVPVENKKLATYAAALSLVKEHADVNNEPIDLESMFIDRLHEDLTEEISYINNFINKQHTLTFKQFVEDGGEGGFSGAIPANNAGTPGVAGFTPDTLGVKKGKKIKVQKRGLLNVT